MNLASDVRVAVRSLSKSPVFTAVAVVSLALGIGANTAIFSLIDQLLLRLLPVRNPSELVLLDSSGNHLGNNRGMNSFSYPMFQDFAAKNSVFSGIFGRMTTPMSVGLSGTTERASGELVSGGYFPTLGVPAVVGRAITPADDSDFLAHPVVMMSYRFWQNRFAGDSSVLNQTLVLNGHNFTVIGVAARGFDGIEPGSVTDLFVPMTMKDWIIPTMGGMLDFKDRRSSWLQIVGRLKPGVSRAQAKASLQVLFHQIIEMEAKEASVLHASEYDRQKFLKSQIDVLPASTGRSFLRMRMTKPLGVLMAVVGLVLLIACGNVANLLLVRAAGRQREIAVRLALGAGRWQIMRQLLIESVLVAMAGAAAGVVIAYGGVKGLISFMPQSAAEMGLVITPDARVLAFNFAVALVTGLLFGLIPALQATNPDVAPTLKDQAGAVAGAGQERIRKWLVSAQVALSLLLLIGAGLFLRSLHSLRDLGPGFTVSNLVSFRVDPSVGGYDGPKGTAFFRGMNQRLAAIPGVQSVALSSNGVMEDMDWESTVNVEGYASKPGEDMSPYFNAVSPAYFATLGVPLLEGRDFRDSDNGATLQHKGIPFPVPSVIIVNETFAKKYFGNSSAVGRHVGFGNDPGDVADMEIIGVVKDFKYERIGEGITRQAFIPYAAIPFSAEMTSYVRTQMPPEQAFNAIRRTVASMDRNLPVYAMRTVEKTLDASLMNERLVASLSTLFAALATMLAVIGLYGVMAYALQQRTREIGIRVALGAGRGRVVGLVMKEVAWVVGIGFAVGLPAAWFASRAVSSLLFGIPPNDPASILAAVIVLGVAALLAGYIPAMRAARQDPLRALRYE